MKIIVTGADGFLGWHTRVRLRALTDHEVVPVGRSNWHMLPSLVEQADAVIHIAGVNRGTDEEVRFGNIRLATDVAEAVSTSNTTIRVIFANSVQAFSDNPYGQGKRAASEILAQAAVAAGAFFTDVVLPNLFGEHGRPKYNSFVANFIDAVVTGEGAEMHDREIDLLHVQSAAQVLLDALSSQDDEMRPQGTATTVGEVYRTIKEQHSIYRRGEIPPLASPLDSDIFNTLRAAMFDQQPIKLLTRTDARGTLVETVRAHGSEGQTFVSTTRPGITRGQHLHLRKVERFVVLSGHARISLRKALTNNTVSFDVTGSAPVAIDMPTLWPHNITNIGTDELVTLFWTNELFNPSDTDTYPEEV